MRTDCRIDGRQVRCPNASLIGYGRGTCHVGDFFVYRHPEIDQTHMARMLARVAYAPALTGDIGPCKNLILALVLSTRASSASERWIDPADVIEVYREVPSAMAAFFFQPKLPYDVRTMRRLIEHGTLQDAYISQAPGRVVEFKQRDETAAFERAKGASK